MDNKHSKFIILSMRRTGSNNLSYLLESHPEILSIGEVFCVEKIWGEPGKKWMNHSAILKMVRDTFPVFFLRLFIFCFHKNKSVGFRFFYEHADRFPSVVLYLLQLQNFKIIHLKRKNLFENLVSLELARETGAWSTLRNKEYGDSKIIVSYQKCLKHFKNSTNAIKKYERIFKNIPTLEISYEDFYKSPKLEQKKVLKFIGVRNMELLSPLKKQNKRKMSDIVENYFELKKRFKNSQWEKFFC